MLHAVSSQFPVPATVPEEYIGLWRRTLLIDEGACEDRSSQVYWLQTGSLYADIRIPPSRQPMRVPPREEQADHALPVLATQQGFAGTLEVQGNALTWQRWLDYQPDTGVPDTGRVHFHQDRLIEEGVHAAYIEHWAPVTRVDSGYLALRLTEERSPSGELQRRQGLWLISGNYFIYAIGRIHEFHQGFDLRLALAHSRHKPMLQQQLMECEIHFGRWHGRTPWEILHSTTPWYEGWSLMTVAGSARERNDLWLQQVPTSGYERRWHIVERRSCYPVPG